MKLMGISPKYAGFLAARKEEKIAVLSGKGGTGKTTVSASLVAVLPAVILIAMLKNQTG